MKQAEHALREVAQRQTALAAVQIGLAHVYGLEMDWDGEKQAAKQAAVLDSTLSLSYFYLSEAEYWHGEYTNARRYCQRGLRLARQNRDVETEIQLLTLSGLIANK